MKKKEEQQLPVKYEGDYTIGKDLSTVGGTLGSSETKGENRRGKENKSQNQKLRK